MYFGGVSKVLARFAAFPKPSSASNVFISDLVDFLELVDLLETLFEIIICSEHFSSIVVILSRTVHSRY